jgi:hypothetical protein
MVSGVPLRSVGSVDLPRYPAKHFRNTTKPRAATAFERA